MCWSSTAHFQEEIQRGLAASSTPLFPPFPCTHLPFLQSVEDRWAVMNPRAGCWFHPPECWPEQCSRKWAGLQRNRVCSCLQSCRRGSMKKWMFTDLFTPQQMGMNGPEAGECGNGKFWVSHIQCVISQPPILLLLPVFLCLLSLLYLLSLTLWHSRDCSSPGSSVLLVSVQGKWTATSLFKLDSVCGFMKTQNVILRVGFCPIWSSKSIPVPRTLHGTWRMLCGWMRADQRTARWSAVC